jgi:hypothetical protein
LRGSVAACLAARLRSHHYRGHQILDLLALARSKWIPSSSASISSWRPVAKAIGLDIPPISAARAEEAN